MAKIGRRLHKAVAPGAAEEGLVAAEAMGRGGAVSTDPRELLDQMKKGAQIQAMPAPTTSAAPAFDAAQAHSQISGTLTDLNRARHAYQGHLEGMREKDWYQPSMLKDLTVDTDPYGWGGGGPEDAAAKVGVTIDAIRKHYGDDEAAVETARLLQLYKEKLEQNEEYRASLTPEQLSLLQEYDQTLPEPRQID
jgi:hypothetical protein